MAIIVRRRTDSTYDAMALMSWWGTTSGNSCYVNVIGGQDVSSHRRSEPDNHRTDPPRPLRRTPLHSMYPASDSFRGSFRNPPSDRPPYLSRHPDSNTASLG